MKDLHKEREKVEDTSVEDTFIEEIKDIYFRLGALLQDAEQVKIEEEEDNG